MKQLCSRCKKKNMCKMDINLIKEKLQYREEDELIYCGQFDYRYRWLKSRNGDMLKTNEFQIINSNTDMSKLFFKGFTVCINIDDGTRILFFRNMFLTDSEESKFEELEEVKMSYKEK